MATSKKMLPVRPSRILHEIVRDVGPIGAATEALLWLGIGVAGIPIPTVGQRDIIRLMNNTELPDQVIERLQQLYEKGHVVLGESASATISATTSGDSTGDSTSDSTGDSTGDSTIRKDAETFIRKESFVSSSSSHSIDSGSDWFEFDALEDA